MSEFVSRSDISYDAATRTWKVRVVALSVPIVFNKHRDHDPNGMMYALEEHKVAIDAYAAHVTPLLSGCHSVADLAPVKAHPLIRPLVLRARVGDTINIHFTNHIMKRNVGMHLVGPGTNVQSDGTSVGETNSLAAPGESVRYVWTCEHEGVFPFHDLGNPSGGENGTNAHGLFGALIVEPADAWWTDSTQDGQPPVADGLYVDVHLRSRVSLANTIPQPFPSDEATRPPRFPVPRASFREYVLFLHDEPEGKELFGCNQRIPNNPCGLFAHPTDGIPHTCLGDDCCRAFRYPNEMEMKAQGCDITQCDRPEPCGHEHHGHERADPQQYHCHGNVKQLPLPGGNPRRNTHCDAHHDDHAHHAGHGSFMLFNYRCEPMKNRERIIWERLYNGKLKESVINEEQHHSSWMFGDPETPILKAYVGDPVRIRLIHAAVKETHVFHLHVYEWYADPRDPTSPLIDAVSITPQTGHTIIPLFGAGNVQAVPGDVIWHCHLYPHFHMGMWGIFRSFDTLQTGVAGEVLATSGVYASRRIGQYPDGTPIEKLAVLPDRAPPPVPTIKRPGYPLFIAGENGQKSPKPPWPTPAVRIPPDYDYRIAEDLELAAMNVDPKPGEMFTRIPHPTTSTVKHDIGVARGQITFNSSGWLDPDGHYYYLADDLKPDEIPPPKEPLFFRAHAGEVLDLTFANRLAFTRPIGPTHTHGEIDGHKLHIPRPTMGQLQYMSFDMNIPPCDCVLVKADDGDVQVPEGAPPDIVTKSRKSPGAECGLHVHIVKFDPIVADGAATGWNYLSAPAVGKKLVYRWWCDEDFGVIFCHDHLFANTRQRHGLFGALIVEEKGSRFLDPYDLNREIIVGAQAVIERADGKRFREFCIGVGDWVAMYQNTTDPPDRELGTLRPINPPTVPSGHGDNGMMAVNYRCAPLHERGDQPELWFSAAGKGDPDTPIFETWPGEEIAIRLVQGSHEEQHSFQIHGMRWRRYRKNPSSVLRNQQTLGISEAFTFRITDRYSVGDHLWKFSAIDDLWTGCWGIIRSHDPNAPTRPKLPPIRQDLDGEFRPPISQKRRRFRVRAVAEPIVYRDGSDGTKLVDPRGLRFVATHMAAPEALEYTPLPASRTAVEPLVLRCRYGEWVEIELINDLPETLEAEMAAPELPIEDSSKRIVSSHVSLHADMVRYDVRTNDGASVGANAQQTVPPGKQANYVFYADVEGISFLQDMADVRDHRHHGLFGALIVLGRNESPLLVRYDAPTSNGETPAWTGCRATIRDITTGIRTEEMVLFLHDGVRYYENGVPSEPPVPADIPGDPGEEGPDPEDQGHKAFNYRSERIDQAFVEAGTMSFESYTFPRAPATPVVHVATNANVRVRLVCASDRARNHGFTIHGHAWRDEAAPTQVLSAETALASGSVRTFKFCASNVPGNYLYRSTVLKWPVPQGAWGILRVH